MIPFRVLVSLGENDAEASSGSSGLIYRALALPVGNKTMEEFLHGLVTRRYNRQSVTFMIRPY